jgi:hypothetical protein
MPRGLGSEREHEVFERTEDSMSAEEVVLTEHLHQRLRQHVVHRYLSEESMRRVIRIYLAEIQPSGPTTSLTMSSALGELGKEVPLEVANRILEPTENTVAGE